MYAASSRRARAGFRGLAAVHPLLPCLVPESGLRMAFVEDNDEDLELAAGRRDVGLEKADSGPAVAAAEPEPQIK